MKFVSVIIIFCFNVTVRIIDAHGNSSYWKPSTKEKQKYFWRYKREMVVNTKKWEKSWNKWCQEKLRRIGRNRGNSAIIGNIGKNLDKSNTYGKSIPFFSLRESVKIRKTRVIKRIEKTKQIGEIEKIGVRKNWRN